MSAQGKPLRCEIIHDNFQNYKKYNVPKAQLVIADIPYNIGADAYGSNPMWYKGGDNANGESKYAKKSFFNSDGYFKIAEYMHFCSRMLKPEPKEKGKAPAMIVFCAFDQIHTVAEYGAQYGFKNWYPIFFCKNYSAQVLKANMRIVGATEFAVVLYRDKLPKFNNGRQISEDGKAIRGTGKKVLEKHWPDVQRWRDVRTLTKESFYERTNLRTVDVISGGFPCQPFSVAGKQKGKEDDRYLWPEMLRVIRELRPHCVVWENVSGLIRVALAEVLSELQNIGYEARAYSSAARDVGGLHKGERIFIVAAANDGSAAVRRNAQLPADGSTEGHGDHNGRRAKEPDLWKRWEVEPRPYGVAHGIPARVDRLKCLGNAVVPQQAYPIFKALKEELGRWT